MREQIIDRIKEAWPELSIVGEASTVGEEAGAQAVVAGKLVPSPTLGRHATLRVEIAGRVLLVDPMLDRAGARPRDLSRGSRRHAVDRHVRRRAER